MQARAEEEFSGANLGDKRLNRRLTEVAGTLGISPPPAFPRPVVATQDASDLPFFNQARKDEQSPHPTYTVIAQREPLGVLDACMRTREPQGPSRKPPSPRENLRCIEGHERLPN